MCFGQTLSVSSGSSISINSGSTISVDGLELAPSTTYTISGPNTINRSNTPVAVGSNTSINRVYNMTSEFSNFLGVLTFSYLDTELNGIAETDLALGVLDTNGVWTEVVPVIDEVNNTLTYDFTQSVGISQVTASSHSSTLTVKAVSPDSYVRVYPNPTTHVLFVVSNTMQKATMFNTAGQKVLESNTDQLDVTDLPAGIYLLNLQNNQNQTQSFKIIKE